MQFVSRRRPMRIHRRILIVPISLVPLLVMFLTLSSTLWGTQVLAQSEFVNEVADGSVNDVGLYTSLALDAQGNPHVSYRDQSAGDLKYARKSGGLWTIEVVDGSVSNAGSYTAIALDSQGNPHLSYYDGSLGDLKYARK